MKKIFIFVLGFAVLAPSAGLAHGAMMDFDTLESGPAMMEYVEDQALQNDELHEEMEGLMESMMSGDLSQEEANRLAQLMDDYPGAGGMMLARQSLGDGGMNRMGMMGMGFGGGGTMGGNWGMMGTGAGAVFAWLGALTWIIWLVVGILAIAWLWKQVQKK